MNWNDLAQDSGKWWAVVNTVLNHRLPYRAENVSTGWGTLSSSRTTAPWSEWVSESVSTRTLFSQVSCVLKISFPSQAFRMLLPLCTKDVSLMYHLSESLALVPVTETPHNFKVDCTVPWIRVLWSSLQMVLIIVFNGADIVDDGLESLLAKWTLCLYLRDQSIKCLSQ
jgi:hypothetical protein